MRFSRGSGWFVLALAVAVAAPVGCSCDKGSDVAQDLNLSWDPATIDFGTVPIHGSSSVTVTLRHSGRSGVVQLLDVRLDTDSTELTVDAPERYELLVGEETSVTVHYGPEDSTVDGGYLVIRHNVAQQEYETRIPISANGQVADLIADPNPIDFGSVKAGEYRDLDIKLKNVGTDQLQIAKIYLKDDASKDFSVQGMALPEGESLPVALLPGDTLGLVLRYEPRGGGADSSVLMVKSTKSDSPWGFVVRGSELGPKIVVFPGQVDFGGVGINQTGDKLITIKNEGNDDLVLKGGWFKLQPGSDPALALPDAPAQDVTLGTGVMKDFHVTWSPTAPKTDDGKPLGVITIESNDATSPTMLSVFGRVDAPIISVIPDTVDFGFGAKNMTIPRTLTIRNEGFGTLHISKIAFGNQAIANEFEIVPDSEFAQAVLAGTPVEIPGQEARPLNLTFTNRGGSTGSANSSIAITSDSQPSPLTVPLTAQRALTAECKITMVPAKAMFGVVPEGFHKDFPVKLVNTGTGYCSFVGAKLTDCMNTMGFSQCQDPATTAKSKVFTFTSLPPTIQNGIPPGGAVTLNVRFTPTASNPMFGELSQFDAVLSTTIYDAQLKQEIKLPNCPMNLGVPQCSANVTGQSGQAKVAILPGEVKFGVTTIGCYSKTYKVCVYNTGNAPLKVDEIAFVGCTPEFKLKSVPPLPKDVTAGGPVCFETVYAPQDLGKDDCVMRIVSNDQTTSELSVSLSGEGTYDSEQDDEFTQVSGQTVDILFIIDDSGSMCDKQERLTNAYTSFIQNAAVWKNDYHIGFIDVNVLDEALMGRLNRGNPNPPARYLTPGTPDSQNKFVKMATMGCDGTAPWGTGGALGGKISDEQEAGLDAAQLALSAPRTSETGEACKTNADCANNKNICSDPKTCPYFCIEGTCGGWNKGFLRQDAQLELIVLSDEEDQSSAALSFYVDFLKNIKGYYNTNMMHFNAIVGVVNGTSTTQGAACTGPDGAMAAEGKRYIETANQTNGKIGSVCDEDYSPVMNQIGKVAFGLKVQFFLSRLADPSSVKVWVNGNSCTQGWKYDAPSNSVIFDDKGTCMPQPGDKIRVHYKTLCLTS